MNILFICTGNTCRSAMAEAYCNARANECGLALHAKSAGIATLNGQAASEDAILVMEELYQIDLSEHRSRRVSAAQVEEADLVLAMTGMHKEILQEYYPESSDKIHTLIGYVQMLEAESRESDESIVSSETHATQRPDEPAMLSQEIPDPYGRGKTVYMETAQFITGQIDKLIACISKTT